MPNAKSPSQLSTQAAYEIYFLIGFPLPKDGMSQSQQSQEVSINWSMLSTHVDLNSVRAYAPETARDLPSRAGSLKEASRACLFMVLFFLREVIFLQH